MLQVQIKEAYAQVLEPLDSTVDQLFQRLAVERTSRQIVDLQIKVQEWENKYQCNYDLFAYRTATDVAYVDELNVHPATQQWEADIITWEFYNTELGEWNQRLQAILTA